MVKSVYIHIPFCNKICTYCDFCKIYYNKKYVPLYLDALEKEIRSKYNNELIETIYIGGGTPSSLSISELERLFDIIKIFRLDKLKEFSIECNFDNISNEKLDLFIKNKVNRISFGLESINTYNLKILGRDNNINKIRNTIDYCHIIGLNNINIDLMYGIENESIEVLEKDLEFVKSLDITHISTYSLIIEDNTILKINNTKYIDQELDEEMYKMICSKLSDFDHYEISNFAKDKNYYCRHNLVYWCNLEYYGFGLSSAGYIDNIRYTNTRSINKYLNSDYIKNNGIEQLSVKDKIIYEIILNLRTSMGIDLDKFYKLYGYNLIDEYDYSDLVNKKLLVILNNHLIIPKDLWYISNSIIVELLESEIDEG